MHGSAARDERQNQPARTSSTVSELPSFTVETNEDGSVTVHLFDDMDDHTATAAWYTFPPESYIATDDITGETIDLTEYFDEDKD